MASKKSPTPEPFDANARRAARNKRVITIGAKNYNPAPDSTEHRASRRVLSRAVDQVTTEIRTINEKRFDADGDLVKELDKKDLDRLDELDVELEDALYGQVANALVDEQGNKPDPARIQEDLDMVDVDAFWEWMAEDPSKPKDPENPS